MHVCGMATSLTQDKHWHLHIARSGHMDTGVTDKYDWQEFAVRHLHNAMTHGKWYDSVADTGWHSSHLHVDRTHGWCDSVTDTGRHSDTYMLTGHMESGATVWVSQGGTLTPTCWQDTWKVVWQCDWHRAALMPALLGHMESGPLWQRGREERDMNTYVLKGHRKWCVTVGHT